MSTRNPFGTGREAYHVPTIVKIENQLANRLRKKIMTTAISYYDPSASKTTPIQNFLADNDLNVYSTDKVFIRRIT